MAKLLLSREQVEKLLAESIQAGRDLTAKAEIAKGTGGYRDWLHLFAKWRDEQLLQYKVCPFQTLQTQFRSWSKCGAYLERL